MVRASGQFTCVSASCNAKAWIRNVISLAMGVCKLGYDWSVGK